MKPRSTRVVSMARTNTRSPFFATERGIATVIAKAFCQAERKLTCARTMVVTASSKLERMLLHSWATSTVNPGMVSCIPSCVTGTPLTAKSAWADAAEPSCNSLMIGFKRNPGKGTIQNKKQKREEGTLKSPTTERNNKSTNPPYDKRQHVQRKLLVGLQLKN
jgi:hypothetical protein